MNYKDGIHGCTKNFIVAICLFIPSLLLANEHIVDDNISGEIYFNEKQYEKAFPLLEDEAMKGIKPSIYRLAHMYQNGLGVKVNYQKAAFWFQQAASEYSYTLVMDTKAEIAKKSFLESLHAQMNPATNKEGNTYILRAMDANTPETSKLFDTIASGDFFGLHPYETNFFLPFGYSTHKYPHVVSDTPTNMYTSQDAYYKNLEAEFQISLTKMLTYNLFGWNEYFNFAYTQKVWWQIYTASAPFRETNFAPELFVGIPASKSINEASGLKLAKLGFIHESNGQGGYRSRSWNRLYLAGLWQWDNLFLSTRVWLKIPESKKYEGYYNGLVNASTGEYEPNAAGDDNPDIQNYLGYGDIKFQYLYGKHEIDSLFRYNFGAGGRN
ncbi:MAG TPA: phospholipase A, partial [Sulfuricurvum sp.]|nr:phospholipase A [Sulfuricurvum sp.]